MANMRIEIAAVHRAAVANCGFQIEERYLTNARSHMAQMKPAFVDEIRAKFRGSKA